MKYNAIIIGLAVALLVSGTEPATAEKPPKHCDFAKARPANPSGIAPTGQIAHGPRPQPARPVSGVAAPLAVPVG